MDKKAAIVGGLAAVGALVAVVALTRPAEAAPPPGPGFTCIWGDGFTANTWAEMEEHYRTAHPDKPMLQFISVVWT